jgi:penicillin-binding protein 1A
MIIRRLSLWLTSIALAMACLGVGLFLLFFYFGRGLPDYEHLKTYDPPALTKVYSAHGYPYREFAKERRIFVPIHEIPLLLIQAFLVAEDKNFFYHCGIDIYGMARAALINTVTANWHNRPAGASTITQQVAKNFLVGADRSFDRKIKEAIMAIRLESSLPKIKILELYLNQIYLGNGAYGVAAAAETYFNKNLKDLSLSEIAFIAAMPKAPSFYPSEKELHRAKTRRDWVIFRLFEEGIITEESLKEAQKHPIELSGRNFLLAEAPYFSEEIRRLLIQRYGRKAFNKGGWTVFSTIDLTLQKKADAALKKGLIAYDRRHGWRGPIAHLDTLDLNQLSSLKKPAGLGNWKLALVLEVSSNQCKIGFADKTTANLSFEASSWAFPALKTLSIGDVIPVSPANESSSVYQLEQIPLVSGALVVMDPVTGKIRALSGGYDFEITQFNCATQAHRQPGSAFKPFVYMAALERGLHPETVILDAPFSVNLGGKLGIYAPKNITGRYYGPTPLRVGIEQSRNVMTIRLAHHIGMRRVESVAKRFGIVDKLPMQLAMALGAAETTVLRLTAGYAMIANGGRSVRPVFIEQIYDRHHNLIYQHIPEPERQLIDPHVIQHMTDMLKGVIERGTAKRLQSLGIPVYGKTGTTNDYKDAWFVGFTQDLVVGVFVGFSSPKTLGEGETGGRVAVPIFEEFMKDVLKL